MSGPRAHSPDFQKMSQTDAFYTGPTAGQLYVKFLAFEGLGTTFSATHLPAVSLDIENEPETHKHWKWDPKRLNQVNEFLVYLSSRNSHVRITIRSPVSPHNEIGTAVIEPARLPMPHLATLWIPISATARVLVHAYWSALLPSQKFADRPEELGDSSFTLLLDRPQYLAGETVAGVVVYRARDGHEHGKKPKSLKSVNLQIAGWSRQDADGDYYDVGRHIFFNHEAILIGHQNQAAMPVQKEYYIWTFNFPLPYSLPPSGLSCGNFYFLHAREVDTNGKTAKSARLYFGVRRVVFPRELLAPAIDQTTIKTVEHADGTSTQVPVTSPATTAALPAGGNVVTPAALPPTSSNKITATLKPLTFTDVTADPALTPAHRSELQRILDEDDSDSDREGTTRRRKRHNKRRARKGKITDAERRLDDSDEASSSLSSSSDSESDDGFKNPRLRKTHKVERDRLHEEYMLGGTGPVAAGVGQEPMVATNDHAAAPVAISPGESTDSTLSQTKVEQIPGATLSEPVEHKTKNEKGVLPPANISSTSTTGTTATSNAHRNVPVSVAIPLRVNPTLTMTPQPSSGRKQLIVPIEIENTTSKPLAYFVVSLNYIIEKSYRYLSTTGNRLKELSQFSRYHVKKFRFKKEAGWPLQPGAKWTGAVTLFMPEDVSPSIDKSNSPLFARTYYVKVHAVRHRHFSRQRMSQRIFLLLGDYDYNTRPLPVQHTHDTPIRFTIFTLPCGTALPTFDLMSTDPSTSQNPVPVPFNAEQSEVVHLEA